MKQNFWKEQLVPLVLTVIIFGVLVGLYYLEIITLNRFTKDQISTTIFIGDILIGLTIYLKTSIDFAIFMGNLMKSNPGWKNRVAIEVGTAVGNALGTFAILLMWDFFKEIAWLLFLMIVVASMVLFRLAKDGVEHAKSEEYDTSDLFKKIVRKTEIILDYINKYIDPVLDRIMPHVSMKTKRNLSWSGLFFFSFSVPFILGLDDFAGYVPLFNIINVFGFGVGVMLGHMILNILLFLSPTRTIALVKNPIISYIGSLAFIALGLWGFYEAFHTLFEAYVH
ncbi:MAG: hypothetical protein M3Q44_01330 [bacterium]|nr:hypothetical protein [bacterium]